MKISYFTVLFIGITISSCHSGTVTNAMNPEAYADSIRHHGLNQLKIVNVNDPVCGMPTLRGFDDTTLFQGKLIGFCSRECKDSFEKNPAAFVIKYK